MARLLPTQRVAIDKDSVLLSPAPSKSSKRTNDAPAEKGTGSFCRKIGGNKGGGHKGGGHKGGAPATGVEGAISSFFLDLCQTFLGAFVGEEGENGAGGASRSQEKSLWDSDACKDYSEDGYGASRRHCDQ
mmetsp:Transcript_38107/g.74646  ORF Transcript_38107/g.74646 Transcript_38107/m.74646 type:complete len:131 (-) Transcript_38107:506-898(-)